MADKYFDPQLLTGANDGSSVANAWKTKEAMLAGSHSVGDRILMMKASLTNGNNMINFVSWRTVFIYFLN